HPSTWAPHHRRSVVRANGSRSPSHTPGNAATTSALPDGAYPGATLLMIAALSTGPCSPSRNTSLSSVGAASAANQTAPAAFDATGGRPSSPAAAGPSHATTTADAWSAPSS